MPFGRDRNGSPCWVKSRDPDGFKKGTSDKKNRLTFETVRTSKPKSQASSTETSMPSVETVTITVAVYLASRRFESSMIQKFTQQRVDEIIDDDIWHKADSIINEANLRDGAGKWRLDRVNDWVHKQLWYDTRVLSSEIDALMDKVKGESKRNDDENLA